MKKVFVLWILSFCFTTIKLFGQSVHIDSSFGINGYSSISNMTDIAHLHFDNYGNIITVGNKWQSGVQYTTISRHAKNGTADIAFGSSGKITDLFGTSSVGRDIDITADDKILVAGEMDYIGSPIPIPTNGAFVAKYKNDGTPDSSFGLNGIYQQTLPAGNIAINFSCVQHLQNNKVLVGGTMFANPGYNSFILRLNSDGTVDNQFGNNGMVQLSDAGFQFTLLQFTLLHDGNLLCYGFDNVISNNTNAAVVKVDQNGNLITGFAQAGRLIIDQYQSATLNFEQVFRAVELASGHILLYGNDTSTFIIKTDSVGKLDSTFGSNSIIHLPTLGGGLALQTDGKILCGGGSKSLPAQTYVISRIDTSGHLDTTFNHNGYYQIDMPWSNDVLADIILQGYDRLIIGGTPSAQDSTGGLIALNLHTGLNVKYSPSLNEINIYPNPFNDDVFISGNVELIKFIVIQDITGRIVETIENVTSNRPLHIDGPTGQYIMSIHTKSGEKVVRKVLKK